MRQNIKNNHTKAFGVKLHGGNYHDFMLFKGDTMEMNEAYLDSLSIVDFSHLDVKNNTLYSSIIWDKSINEGVSLNNIGFTGVDNGLISFRRDKVTNEEFLNIYLNSELNIASGDTRLFLNPVIGNTLDTDYPLYIKEDNDGKYISCQGGFYQGFFKLHGHKYQVLPNKLENDWLFHFELRPRTDYISDSNIANDKHPENKGIFFFMGTRAENKFWPFYKKEKSELTQGIKYEGWAKDENIPFLKDDYFAANDNYFSNNEEVLSKTIIDKNGTQIITTCNNYYIDDYYNDECIENNGKFVENDYIGSDISADISDFKDSEGHNIDEWGLTEIESDNKFLMFDRTASGFTTKNWVEGSKITISRKQHWPNANYFLLMNRTETGYTTSTIDSYNEEHSYDFNIYKDIRDNVFALRITDEGAIGYRYGVFNCENIDKYELIEEYSKKGIINNDNWNTVNVRCVKISDNKMRLMFYVNGFLVFKSKELKSFNFKSLDEIQEKQEGVPYNISLGGGSLGLMETVLPNYYAISDYILPIERDFCGTFIGDIKTFKMYEGFIDYSSITNYLS